MSLQAAIETEMENIIANNAMELSRESRADQHFLATNIACYRVLQKVMDTAGHPTYDYAQALNNYLALAA